MPSKFHCLEFWRIEPGALCLPYEERRLYIEKANLIKTVESADGFPESEFEDEAPLAWHEEAAVILFFAVVIGGPLVFFLSGAAVAIFGTWMHVLTWAVIGVFLSRHPLPKKPMLEKTWLTISLWKYFTYKYIWCDDDLEEVEKAPAWVAVAPPHGVIPIANMCAYAATNFLMKRKFVGTAASVVRYTPFFRYGAFLLDWVDVSAKSITRACELGQTVGVVPDGIAGIFTVDHGTEIVALKDRKGLAKLGLRSGLPLLPCYSLGNTGCYSMWHDRYGFLERLSRFLKASIFIFWGRWGLPIPRRVKVTFVFGRPILVDRDSAPSDSKIDSLHSTTLKAVVDIFDMHKRAYGWGSKELQLT